MQEKHREKPLTAGRQISTFMAVCTIFFLRSGENCNRTKHRSPHPGIRHSESVHERKNDQINQTLCSFCSEKYV